MEMLQYKEHFEKYCKENGLSLSLSFTMPDGYETAFGTFDSNSLTVFINKNLLNDREEFGQAFYLFHELRHALQYINPKSFNNIINESLSYIIMYDGTCYKKVGDKYYKYKINGDEEFLKNLYISQPYEMDANEFAYKKVCEVMGFSKELEQLYHRWIPKSRISNETYRLIYKEIDKSIKE
ncbi:MAG: hypothetical protein HXL49_09035 [Solobacterium sp.]|nr:hypothetical protein [Solobacterium sp.]